MYILSLNKNLLIFTVAISFFISTVISCESVNHGRPKPPQPNYGKEESLDMNFPKTAAEYLGKQTITEINSAQEGESYKLHHIKKDSEDTFEGYPIQKLGLKLTKTQREQLQEILLDSKSYIFTSAKKVSFGPKFGIRLGDVKLLIDYNNLLLAVPFNGRSRIEDFDPVKVKIKTLLKELFPEENI